MSRQSDNTVGLEIIAELSLTHESLALSNVVATHPDVDIEITAQAPGTMQEWLLFFTAGETDFTEFESSILTDPTVAEPSLVSVLDDHRVYRVRVESGIHVAGVLADLGFRVLQIESDGEGWRFRVQGPNQRRLATFFEYCEEAGIGYTLDRLYETTTTTDLAQPASTPTPYQDTLELAHEGGYFEVPRRMTLDDLAGELDISRQTASERVRHGVQSLLDESY
ncbi:bacterio-opsin activator domain-containing protein [Haloarchaeobius sp. DFWS5]|uniref:helix-turn-helix domain-containing protein n=1 Tax=Haloarchaeobius sp. DFWS5 TaxID=3446114 RepID=UPI003EBD0424